MDQTQYEVEQTVSILSVENKSCSETFTPTKKPHHHVIPHFDVGLVSPTPEKTEETLNNRRKPESAKLLEKQTMDQKPDEVEETANILPVARKLVSESFTPTKKPQIHEIPHFDANLVSLASEKTEETKELVELPEKYRLLSELFDCMTTSLRLLKLRKQLAIFQNIRRVVETLTGRKFSYKNLAQIKFILPEAVQTDKILLHNKKTLCMEPHMKVTLVFDVIEGHLEHSDYMALSRLISSRLFKFVNEHSEDYDVPEAELPEPFNRKEITVSANPLPVNSSNRILPNLNETEPLSASHLPPSFKRHFSSKELKTKLSQSHIPLSSVKEAGFSTCLDTVKQGKDLQVAGDTPMKEPLVANEINIETPDLSTPKRSVSIDDKPKSMVTQKVMASSLFVKRTLVFSSSEEENALLDGTSTSTNDPATTVNKGLDLKSITEELK